MAKKKQRKKVYKPPAPKLETQFSCPECGRKKVVEVRFIKKENKGYLRCRACGEQYETKLKRASTPIDIYYSWIDERDQKKEKENDLENNNPEEEDNVEEGEVEGEGDGEGEGEGEENGYDEEQQQESEEEQYKEKDDPGDDEEEESA